jgi:hypothetical protein
MTPLTKILLKNGVNGLLNEEDEYFKENICQALAFKLNESLEQTQKEATSLIFVKESPTPESQELTEFLNFVNNPESRKYEFKNNSVINITEYDINAVKTLFESLDAKNREMMVKEIFKDSTNFKKHVDFYAQVKGLIS